MHVKGRRNLLKKVKGYKWGRKKLIKLAKTAQTKAGAHAFMDRRKKKRTNRGLWQIKINAFVREQGLSYSRFIDALKKNNIELDRKVLADLAVNNKKVLTKIVEEVTIKK
jgi:large subunit ribosomal protein L20